MAQRFSSRRCLERAHVQQRPDERDCGGVSSPASRKFCDRISSREQPPEQREQHRTASLSPLATPESLLAPPTTHRFVKVAAAARSDDVENCCGRSFSAAAAAGAVARFEMEESLGESDDGCDSSCSSSNSSSTFTNSCGGGRSPGPSNSSRYSSSSSTSSARSSMPAWGARSKLPFHMLPFEVQAYHLQQQKLRQSHNKHSRNAGSSSISRLESGGADSSPQEATALPADEEEEQSAVVESAWFPLMPPAMAGEARPVAPTEHVEISSSSDGTCGATMTCWPEGTTNVSGALREDGARLERQQKGFGCHWAGAAREVVHLTALRFPRGTSANSTATTASTSSATLSSASSFEGFEDAGARTEIGGWQPGRWSSAASASHSPLPPTQPPSPTAITSTPTGEITAAALSGPLANHCTYDHHPEPAAAVFFGSTLDDPRGVKTKALMLAALSGFALKGAATLQAVSLDLSNACRALAPWSLRVAVDGETGQKSSRNGEADARRGWWRESDEHDRSVVAMPALLAEHVWPRSNAARRERSLGSGEINTNTRHNTTTTSSRRHTRATTTAATPTRLLPRRWITRVKVESTGRRRGGVTHASWPVTMVHLEFGDRFNSPVEGIILPEGLEVVKFGARFNQPVSRIRWPASLRELSFGNDFNQPVSGIDFPPGVRRLDFGERFNFVVSAVDLPEELRELRFGHGFNREIAGVRWPPKLSKLAFCGELQQKVEDVALPDTLTHLALLGDFDQPVHAVRWPAGLTTIRFGDRFQQPLAGVTSWPPRLETVVLGRGYSKSLCRCVLVPSSEGEPTEGLQIQVRRSGGDGGGVAADVGSANDKNPPLGEAPLRVLVAFERDDHAGQGNFVSVDSASCGDATMRAVESALQVDGWDQHRLAAEDGAAPDDESLTFGDVGTDVDVDHDPYWDDEDDDGGGGGHGLPYVDVFGYEDVAWDWDMEDPRLSSLGTY